jgi:hypothetical protein
MITMPSPAGDRPAIDKADRASKTEKTAKGPLTAMVEVANADDARSWLEAWERLADRSLERNVFAEPWMLLPALECFADGEGARVGLVVDSSAREVLGVFPFVRRRRWNRLPIAVASSWSHEQSYLGTPLLHPSPELAKRAITGFLDALARETLVEFNDVAGDGKFMHLLTEVIAERKLGWLLTDSVTRPVLIPRDDADAYLAEALDGDARRKLRSKEKGLSFASKPPVGRELRAERWRKSRALDGMSKPWCARRIVAAA